MPTLPACVRACLRACVRARMRTYEGAATLLHGTDSFTHPDLMVDNVEDARALILTGGTKLMHNIPSAPLKLEAATGYNKVIIIIEGLLLTNQYGS